MTTTELTARDYVIVAAGAVLCTVAIVVMTLVLDHANLTTLNEEVNKANLHSDLMIPTLLALPNFTLVFWKIRQLGKARQYLETLAFTDSLTGVLNRRAFQDRVDAILRERWTRTSALLIIDLDHFKQVNDNLGHDTGDQALVKVADAISARLQNGEIFGRIGGEEFVVFIPSTTPEIATLTAEVLRMSVQDMEFGRDTLDKPLTISIGLATGDKGSTFASLYKAADKYLYLAKEKGRNRVEQAERIGNFLVGAGPDKRRSADAA